MNELRERIELFRDEIQGSLASTNKTEADRAHYQGELSGLQWVLMEMQDQCAGALADKIPLP